MPEPDETHIFTPLDANIANETPQVLKNKVCTLFRSQTMPISLNIKIRQVHNRCYGPKNVKSKTQQ